MARHETVRRRSLAVGIVEDDPIMGESLVQRLGLEGWDVSWWRCGEEAVEALGASHLDAIICDIRLPDMDGENVYRRAMPDIGTTPVIFVTAFGDIEQAVRLVRLGADDYITKPFSIEELLRKLSEAVEQRCPEQVGDHSLGASEAMRRVEAVLRRVRDVDSPVVLVGEIGTGKEIAARFLHGVSGRREGPFLAIDCAMLAKDLPPSGAGEVAGGPDELMPSLIERGRGGFLFLDNVCELPSLLQARLVGLVRSAVARASDGAGRTGTRLVCSSRCGLAECVEAGRFRDDLFYDLNVITVSLPALRYRPDDIVPLTMRFLSRHPGPPRRLTAAAEEALLTHAWPGNVRELQNRVERALAMTEAAARLTEGDLFPEREATKEPDRVPTLAEVRAGAERRHISAALAETGGEIGRTAALLGVSRTTLWEKMRRLGLSAKE